MKEEVSDIDARCVTGAFDSNSMVNETRLDFKEGIREVLNLLAWLVAVSFVAGSESNAPTLNDENNISIYTIPGIVGELNAQWVIN